MSVADPLQSTLPAPNVLIGVTGGIAAYKVCEVTSTVAKAGINVRVLMTEQAQSFVSAVTFAALSRQPVLTDADFWSAQQGRPLHIELGEWADVFAIAPLTANTLGKLANGLADNLLTNTVLASTCPVLLAPAMNTDMWLQYAVQQNIQRLCPDTAQASPNDPSTRFHIVGPAAGRLACDRVGQGRMAEPQAIVTYLQSLAHKKGKRDLAGKHLLISTGSTREFIDPVRYIGNPATGKMGIALAQAAQHRGAQVTLVHGPLSAEVTRTLPADSDRIAITTAAEMEQHMLARLPRADWVIMAAAVADVRPANTAPHKLPKKDLPQQLPLAPVPDIVSQLSDRKSHHQLIVGFAAQTGDILPPALSKLTRKGLDAIVANPIDQPSSGFGSDTNEAIILLADGQQRPIARCSKLMLAHHLYDQLITLRPAQRDRTSDSFKKETTAP
ncbi:MAG: bifunctional phosphopantothenoylcysteine decarboxylase/phosphopantothenate--cysteine ligase CoaBC [Cyanobacteria bacterium J06607_13]